jgi:hypothetical protein
MNEESESYKTRPMNECRCDERLKTKSEKSTHFTYTGLFGELPHLKIKTRLIFFFQNSNFFIMNQENEN